MDYIQWHLVYVHTPGLLHSQYAYTCTSGQITNTISSRIANQQH